MRKVMLVGYLLPKESAISAEDQYLMLQFNDEVWNAVFQLPTKYREVLLLQAHHELTIQEISMALGLSIDAVKSRLRRAKRKASENLAKVGELRGNAGY
jgi:RNA polymerase sigma-70 factor (ECF subfamily)